MTETMTATTDQWMQFYQQSPMDGLDLMPAAGGFSDATVVTASPTMSSEAMNLSAASSSTASGQLSPKGNLTKPIRRRSRASKRTPTTLLNADTTNFRALVQQFTGCPTTTLSLGFDKGPVTLNFQQGGHVQYHHHTTSTTPLAPLIGNGKSYNEAVADGSVTQPKQLTTQQRFQQVEYQRNGYSLDNFIKNNTFAPSSDSSKLPGMEVSDGLLLNNDLSLYELSIDAFSNDDHLM